MFKTTIFYLLLFPPMENRFLLQWKKLFYHKTFPPHSPKVGRPWSNWHNVWGYLSLKTRLSIQPFISSSILVWPSKCPPFFISHWFNRWWNNSPLGVGIIMINSLMSSKNSWFEYIDISNLRHSSLSKITPFTKITKKILVEYSWSIYILEK